MALVTKGNGSGFYLTVTLKDTQGDASVLEYELDAPDMATAVTDSAIILAALNGISASTVSGYAISLRYEENAFAFPVGADNSIKARITFRIQGSSDIESYDVPAPEEAIFVAASGPSNNIVDVDDALVVAYSALFTTAGQAFISDGERLSEALEGQRVSSRKRWKRT